tara:strand:- start:1968 stop:2318 length:351 start_codon:yes stop_codon:yes gene_type:complete
MKPPIKKNRKKHLRNLERNKSGREATVKMGWGAGTNQKGKEVYYASPTITFKGDEKVRPQTFKQAIDAGEVYEFKKQKTAERFAAGGWKKGKAKRQAMTAFRAKKKNERINRKNNW